MSTRERLARYFPAFGLEVRTPKLVLRLPDDDDLVELTELAVRGVHPPEQMPFTVPWTAVASPHLERNSLGFGWLSRASLQSEDWRLNLVTVVDGEIVGTQGVMGSKWSATKVAESGSWIGQNFQGRGIGREMRHAALQLMFDGFGAAEALTFAYADNPASLAVTRALGYEPNGVDRVPDPVGEGSRELLRFRMTSSGFDAIRRDDIELVGAAETAAVFGTEQSPPRWS